MPVLSDSSPLILFARIRRLELLRDLFGEIWIPQAVEAEVVAEARGRPGGLEIATAPWIRVVEAPRTGASLGLPASLGPGEAEVIALAVELASDGLVLLDDGPARRAARGHGLAVVGSAGALVLAKDADLLPLVRPVLDDLPRAGLFVGDDVYRDVLRAASEV